MTKEAEPTADELEQYEYLASNMPAQYVEVISPHLHYFMRLHHEAKALEALYRESSSDADLPPVLRARAQADLDAIGEVGFAVIKDHPRGSAAPPAPQPPRTDPSEELHK